MLRRPLQFWLFTTCWYQSASKASRRRRFWPLPSSKYDRELLLICQPNTTAKKLRSLNADANGCLFRWLVGWFVVWMVVCFVGWLVGLLFGWLIFFWLVGRYVLSLVGVSDGWSIYWLVCYLVAGWLVGCLVDWLVGWTVI